MKICLLVPSFLPGIGGLEKAADTLATLMQSWGHRPVVLAQRSHAQTEGLERPYPIHVHPRPRSATWWPHCITAALNRWHQHYDFDLIWAFQAYPQGYAAVCTGRRQRLPVVISSRGGDISDRSRYLRRGLPKRRIAWALRHAAAVTTLNRHLSRRVETLTEGQTCPHLIFNGVALPSDIPERGQPPAALKDLRDRPYMLTMTRLHRFKGIDLIIAAVGLLKSRGVSLPLLVIAGSGSQGRALREQVVENDLASDVRFTRDVAPLEKTWLLAHCQFLVQPSREGEGMPNSVLEAMSYAKPILGADSPGISELVTDGVCGMLSPPEDASLLAEALERMMNSDVAQLGRSALSVAQTHTWERCTRQYLELFEAIVNDLGPGKK
ncbi:MAG: glycosyltransferase family 4 protein [Planctomycetes bacterium]|nr:glycosyltransferase family 4 protein [Planctomycetota bacterium]